MKKNYIILGVMCVFLLVAGVCYSYTYRDHNTSVVRTSLTLTDSEEKKVEEKEEQNNSVVSSVDITTGEKTIDPNTSSSSIIYIFVHICGAVTKPGVYQTHSEARLVELIELSGGLTKDAAGDFINQAQSVTDGQRIYIPTQDEVMELSVDKYMEGTLDIQDNLTEVAKRVNINEADVEELTELPGIGDAKAKNIIDYRKMNGKFKSIDDIMNIPGIKAGLYDQISSYITVE